MNRLIVRALYDTEYLSGDSQVCFREYKFHCHQGWVVSVSITVRRCSACDHWLSNCRPHFSAEETASRLAKEQAVSYDGVLVFVLCACVISMLVCALKRTSERRRNDVESSLKDLSDWRFRRCTSLLSIAWKTRLFRQECHHRARDLFVRQLLRLQ